MSTEAGPSSQRITSIITYETSQSTSPAPTPAPATSIPVSATPAPRNYLVSMAEQVPAKPTTAFSIKAAQNGAGKGSSYEEGEVSKLQQICKL
jgi:hypothetical protein